MAASALVLVGTWTGTTVSAAPRSSLSPYDVQESTAYLTARYQVSADEALRRLELQNRIPELQQRISKLQPDAYAGMWLDQDHGGVLVIGSTATAQATLVTASEEDAAHIRVQQARWSLRDLQATAQDITAKLQATSGSSYQVVADQKLDAVAITPHKAKGQDPRGQQAIDALAAASHGKITVLAPRLPGPENAEPENPSRTPAEPQRGYTQPCPVANCWPPMMGGYRLDIKRSDGSEVWGGCSAGFNVKGDKNGQAYVLTAGHCLLPKHHPGDDDRTYHNGIPVGTKKGAIIEKYQGAFDFDFSFVPYQTTGDSNWADYWINNRAKKNGVFTRCKPGTRPCQPDTTYISGMAAAPDIKKGEVVCAAGSANEETTEDPGGNDRYEAGTHCGQITQFRGIGDTVIIADICSREGDSGGALYSQTNRKAYGTLRGTIAGAHGPCQVGQENSDYITVESSIFEGERKGGNNVGLRVIDDRDNR
ncbi:MULTISPECIES: chymotrypsin family serine protease [Amycolatopsis]|uniref:Peptidase S1 domain-containing protein n=1 Tax=Amycolatopsis albidoflavus TaxID=102226 RepID=A0ABW5HW37_9PSEU